MYSIMNKKFIIITFFSAFFTLSFTTDYCKNRVQNHESRHMAGVACLASCATCITGYAASIAPSLGLCIFFSTESTVCGCTAILIPAYDIYNFYKIRQEDRIEEDRIQSYIPQAQEVMGITPQPTRMLHPGWNRLE